MIYFILSSLLLLIGVADTQDLTRKETITRTLQFTNHGNTHQLLLKNISGDVKVVGYDGNEVKITVEKTIKARNESDLQRGMEQIQLATQVEDSIMVVYMDAPFVDFRWKNGYANYRVDREDDDYSYRMDFTVQVPRNLNLDVSTVNDGIVEVEKVNGQHIEVHNVNGGIRCSDISGKTTAITVNGDVDIQYVNVPSEDSHFKTINGDITLVVPEDLSADVSFKSMHGDMYTNFEELQPLPAEVNTQENNSGKRTTYKIDKRTKLRIGNGGALFQVETLNGELYLKHN